jgi:integrase
LAAFGFLDIGDFNALLEKTPERHADARDIIEFLYHTGWRSAEAKNLQWSWVDDNIIRLPKEFSKNKKERVMPISGVVMDVLARRNKLRRLDCPYVFHRNSKPIKSFRRLFKMAAKEINHPELLPHDMRRSAVRNFRKSGWSEGDGMMLRSQDEIGLRDTTSAMTRTPSRQ